MKLFVVTMLTLAVLSLAAALPARAVAEDHQKHGVAPDTTEQRKSTNDLVRTIREATERFRDVTVAEAEGYHPLFGCVSGDSSGAMGLHYVNMDLVGDPAATSAVRRLMTCARSSVFAAYRLPRPACSAGVNEAAR